MILAPAYFSKTRKILNCGPVRDVLAVGHPVGNLMNPYCRGQPYVSHGYRSRQ